MCDTDATRGRHHIADPLREHAVRIYGNAPFPRHNGKVDGFTRLMRIADEIDREHERRMEQQSYELRRAFCRYMGGVLNDYRHGMKRKRLRK